MALAQDPVGKHLGDVGHEFGATGRLRRTGWFDAVAMRRAIQINSLSGICLATRRSRWPRRTKNLYWLQDERWFYPRSFSNGC